MELYNVYLATIIALNAKSPLTFALDASTDSRLSTTNVFAQQENMPHLITSIAEAAAQDVLNAHLLLHAQHADQATFSQEVLVH